MAGWSYDKAMDYLNSRTNYEKKWPSYGPVTFNLERMRALLAELGFELVLHARRLAGKLVVALDEFAEGLAAVSGGMMDGFDELAAGEIGEQSRGLGVGHAAGLGDGFVVARLANDDSGSVRQQDPVDPGGNGGFLEGDDFGAADAGDHLAQIALRGGVLSFEQQLAVAIDEGDVEVVAVHVQTDVVHFGPPVESVL